MIQQIQQRDRTWDIVKGIGILLVVIAHTRDPLPLHRTIYLFHMGLFYFIGGYFLKVDYRMKAKHSVVMFIKKKITALYLPYTIAGSLLLLMNPLFVKFGWDNNLLCFYDKIVGIIKFVFLAGGGYMSVALWFAKSLFVALIALYIILRLVKSIYVRHIIFVLSFTVGWLLYAFQIELPWSLEREVTVLPLCYLGYIANTPPGTRSKSGQNIY